MPFAIGSVLEGGIALQLSPDDVNTALRILEKLALPAPPASLGYGNCSSSSNSSTGGGRSSSLSAAHWPSLPVPRFDDETFGFAGDAAALLRAAIIFLGDSTSGATKGTSAASNMADNAGRVGLGVMGYAGFDSPSHGWLALDHGLRSGAVSGTAMAAVAAATLGNKPSFCLVTGDALGARLLGWCTVACRSPQWRDVFSRGVLQRGGNTWDNGEDGQDACATRAAEYMEVSSGDADASRQGVEEDCGGDDREDSFRNNDQEGKMPQPPKISNDNRATPTSVARLLCAVTQVVCTIKGHFRTLEAERDRTDGTEFFSSGGGAPTFDIRSRESSGALQALVGDLADAIMDMFAHHVADPAVHRQLLRLDDRVTEESWAGAPGAIANVVSLMEGTAPDQTVGLTVELLSDIAWLFSCLEPKGGGGSGDGDRSSASKARSAAALLSSSMSCWVSGRLLACMPGREQLEYALNLPQATDREDGIAGVAGGGSKHRDDGQLSRVRPRPLPARLASFAVRTLLENLQVARERESEAATERVTWPPRAEEVSRAARACAGRSTSILRVALILEQMPSWRGGWTWANWQKLGLKSLDGSTHDGVEEAASDDNIAGIAAAAAEVLHVLVALLCAATEYERLNMTRREQTHAAEGQRKPTIFSVGSIGNLVAPTVNAIAELVGPPTTSSSGVLGGGSSLGLTGSTRSFLPSGGKKRCGSAAGGGSGSNAGPESRLSAFVVRPLAELIDRVHLAGLLLAWEPWHPWKDKVALNAARSSSARTPPASRHSRNWQLFMSLADRLGQACLSPRPAWPPEKSFAALMIRTVVSFRSTDHVVDGQEAFLDMPSVLLLAKVHLPRHVVVYGLFKMFHIKSYEKMNPYPGCRYIALEVRIIVSIARVV